LSRLPLLALLLAATAGAADRQIPFWPDTVPDAIHAAVDGQAALETVRALGRYHRVQGSPGYAAAAQWVRQQALAAGMADATVEHFPADGSTRYAHFRSYLGWDAQDARLEEVTPHTRPVTSFPQQPVALADYSQDADVKAQLVSVGAGATAADYQGRDVKGKLVLASGALPMVHQLAVEERGALGILSDYPNQSTAWSGDDTDQVRWGHLSPYQTGNRFAFMLSKRQANDYRARLDGGEAVTLHAVVHAHMTPGAFDVVSATIPGTDPAAGEVVLTAHLCHQSAGANDNASGSAAILQVARTLNQAIRSGAIARPRLTIRFLWTPEISGSQAWLASHPELHGRIIGGIHMDMVGALLETTHSTFHLSRTAQTLPHVLNDIGLAFFDQVTTASAHYAERGGDAYAGFATPGGSRDVFLGDMRQLELGSDHEVFESSGWGVPMLYFHDWPDVTIHTSKDQPENLDVTKLGRVVYLGAGIAYTLAALPDAEAPRLLALTRYNGEQALAQARLRAALSEGQRDGPLAVREALAMNAAELQTLARRWPSTAAATRMLTERIKTAAGAMPVPAALDRDGRVPLVAASIRGPLMVYYYDHVSEQQKARDIRDAALPALPEFDGDAELMLYEAMNLADGHRSIGEIGDILSGRYGPVPQVLIAAHFERLARVGIVSWK
jgi:aminopeptidase YwaD